MKYLFVLLMISASFSLRAQQGNRLKTHRDSIVYLQQIIRNGNMLTSERVGFAGSPSRSWYSLALLSAMANTKELIAMTKDRDAVIRTYGYLALRIADSANFAKLKNKSQHDQSVVKTLTGCIAADVKVADIITDPNRWYDAERAQEFVQNLKTNEKQRKDIFGQVIRGEIKVK